MLGSERELVPGLDQELALGSERELVPGLELESVPGSELVRGSAMALEWGKSFVRVDHLESQQK